MEGGRGGRGREGRRGGREEGGRQGEDGSWSIRMNHRDFPWGEFHFVTAYVALADVVRVGERSHWHDEDPILMDPKEMNLNNKESL